MNDIISILKNYFNEKTIDIVKKDLSKKQRTWIMNDNYFAKVGKNSNILFFNNLVNEIKLYKNNQGNVLLPKLVESFVSDEYCLIILEKDNGKTLSNQRNDYSIGLSDSQRIEIAKNVLNIKNIKINCEINNNYSRKVSLDKYLERSKKYISEKSYLKILSLYNVLSKESKKIVIAHGDLTPTNIMMDKNLVRFIDWEYISYMPEFYDLAFFLMFSKENNSLDILDELSVDNKEVYIDSVIICLKEISNWSKLYGEIDNSIIDKNIERWNKELDSILRKI